MIEQIARQVVRPREGEGRGWLSGTAFSADDVVVCELVERAKHLYFGKTKRID